MSSCLERSLEVFINDCCCFFVGNEASWQHETVGIVVLAYEMSYLYIPAKTCTHTVVLVESHCHAFARTTDADAAAYYASLDILCERVSKVWIVARTVAVCSEVFVFDTFLLKILENELL